MSDVVDALKKQLDEIAATLKPMHLKMAQELLEGKTQEEAYISAGGKGKTARQQSSHVIKNNPAILEYVSLVKKIAYESALPEQIATLEQKRELLWKIAQHCSDIALLKVDNEGNEIDTTMRNPVAAKEAIAELNKMDGHLATIKKAITTQVPVSYEISIG